MPHLSVCIGFTYYKYNCGIFTYIKYSRPWRVKLRRGTENKWLLGHPVSMGKNRKAAFIERHCSEYGLKITTRHAGGAVESVACRFCLAFGREECNGDGGDSNASARKRKRTSNIKYFSSFRADNYKTHLKAQHPQKWSEYQRVNQDSVAADEIFNTDVPFVNTLDAHLDIEKPQSYVINGKIVDTIIGDMLFDPEDDDDEVSKQQALSMFKRSSDSYSYTIEIKIRDILEKHNTQTAFNEAWAAVHGRFKELMDFSGGLATVFPGTAAVESDFSVLKYEKNSYRTALLDLTLEGIMHCKQYKAVFKA